MVRAAESAKSTRSMCAQKQINYTHLNTGIDSEPDHSPPRKKKRDIVAALREPSQTVLSAHQQHITRHGLRKLIPSPDHKTPKLVGTMIISPLAKTFLSNKEIKQEDDWLKLPKNVPTETRSLMDPLVKFTIKHVDGSICQHKKTWAFYNRKQPLVNENDQSNISNLQTTSVTTQSNLGNTENTENSPNITKTHEQISEMVSRDNVNTENHLPTESSLESSDDANQNNTENHVHAENNGDKTDWEKLVINSNDSLFEEMTKQWEKDHSSDKSDVTETTTPKTNRDPTESEGKLPDLIHYSQDAVTGLLLLGASVIHSMDNIVDKAIDAEINNEEILPVNAPKLPDFTKVMQKTESDKKSKPNSSSGPKPSKAQRNSNKHKPRILPETESSSTDMPKSPSVRLTITKHRLKKTPVTTTSVRKVCCTVCRKAFDDKDELKKHHHATHTNSQCDVCNKSFATKRSLCKHSYMHLEKQIKCKNCDQKFSFNSELEIHKIKHLTKPTFKCTVIGCDKEYYRKSELTAHMVNHVGPPIKCLKRGAPMNILTSVMSSNTGKVTQMS